MARVIDVAVIAEAVKDLCRQANFELPLDVKKGLKRAAGEERSGLGKEILSQLLENAEIAAKDKVPLCQDTGLVTVFAEIGQDVRLGGGSLSEAINRGVSEGYQQGYLRPSIVSDPLTRVNTGDNTPAVIHYDIVAGDKVKVCVIPKGGGAENMSAVAMLKPADGRNGISEFVLDAVRNAGANPCPPIVVGLGIGGNFETAPLLAKKALLREVGSVHPVAEYARLEQELLAGINKTGIGPQGMGGKVTALAVHIEYRPCHIASLPAAVNIQCHAARHKEAII